MRKLLTYAALAGLALTSVGCATGESVQRMQEDAKIRLAQGEAFRAATVDHTREDVWRDGAVEACNRLAPGGKLTGFNDSKVQWISNNTWEITDIAYPVNAAPIHFAAKVVHAGDVTVMVSLVVVE